MKNLNHKHKNMAYLKIDAKDRVPVKNTRNGRVSPIYYSDSYFVMTDNGPAIAYYNFEDNEWHIHHNDIATKVVFWLEEDVSK